MLIKENGLNGIWLENNLVTTGKDFILHKSSIRGCKWKAGDSSTAILNQKQSIV